MIDWSREFMFGWEYVERLTDKSHGEYNLLCRQRPEGNRPDIFECFNEKGLSRGGTALENIPEEPEREEGWYVVIYSKMFSLAFFHADTGEWRRGCVVVKEPDEIVCRHYMGHEYRPADKCLPARGQDFEVEGVPGSWSCYWGTCETTKLPRMVYTSCQKVGHKYGLELLDGKKWRPLNGE